MFLFFFFKMSLFYGMFKFFVLSGSVLFRLFGISWFFVVNFMFMVEFIFGWDMFKSDCMFLRLLCGMYFSGIEFLISMVGWMMLWELLRGLYSWKFLLWELGCEVFGCSKMDFLLLLLVMSIWLFLFVNFLLNCFGYNGSALFFLFMVIFVMMINKFC